MNIVVVDDDPAIVTMCRKVLGEQGHQVQGFTSTSEALAHLAAGPNADLLVVDYKMPELNGIEFIQRAWQLQPKLRVVMITAHGSRELQGQAAETGVHGLVLKPFTPTELTRSVDTAFGR
ncbi:MAG: response regulator [Candidatus Rokubacteria bacterium]|nr:response regulator [Candidatus Rokubacteria bacterium]